MNKGIKKIRKAKYFLLAMLLVFNVFSFSSYAIAAGKQNEVEYIMKNGILLNKKAKLVSEDGTEYAVNVYQKTTKINTKKSFVKSKLKSGKTITSYVTEYAVKLDLDNMTLVNVNVKLK